MSNYTPTTDDFYLMKQQRDEARAHLAEMSATAVAALTELADIRAVLNGYPDSDLVDLAKQHAHQVAIFAALVESGAVTQEQCVAVGRGLDAPSPLYDWNLAPDWAQWVAMDKVGEVWAYERKPVTHSVNGEDISFDTTGGKAAMVSPNTLVVKSVDWAKSLEARPVGRGLDSQP
jgi:hypothetical protein